MHINLAPLLALFISCFRTFSHSPLGNTSFWGAFFSPGSRFFCLLVGIRMEVGIGGGRGFRWRGFVDGEGSGRRGENWAPNPRILGRYVWVCILAPTFLIAVVGVWRLFLGWQGKEEGEEGKESETGLEGLGIAVIIDSLQVFFLFGGFNFLPFFSLSGRLCYLATYIHKMSVWTKFRFRRKVRRRNIICVFLSSSSKPPKIPLQKNLSPPNLRSTSPIPSKKTPPNPLP